MSRKFEEWLETFRESICSYEYYVDFKKVFNNVDKIKIELNILNSLIGSKNIESDFENLIKSYPETLKCIPILLAVRKKEIFAMDEEGSYKYNFKKPNYTIEEYKKFMRKTGLFDLLTNYDITNLVDYVTGIETGLDSNGRKNRGGHIMEDLVESYLKKEENLEYYKEMRSEDIEKKWGLDLSPLSNGGKTVKRFDFVIKTDKCVYAIEVNFYTSSGSKLNETARSYKMIAEEAKNIPGFKFIWFTDGYEGWKDAKKNLEETFDVLDTMYNITDLENGVLKRIIK